MVRSVQGCKYFSWGFPEEVSTLVLQWMDVLKKCRIFNYIKHYQTVISITVTIGLIGTLTHFIRLKF